MEVPICIITTLRSSILYILSVRDKRKFLMDLHGFLWRTIIAINGKLIAIIGETRNSDVQFWCVRPGSQFAIYIVQNLFFRKKPVKNRIFSVTLRHNCN